MPKVSAKHAEARRNQILDAAMACFAQHGIRDTTIKAICEAAGLSTGAVYGYFRSKQEIVQAVFERDVLQNRGIGEQLAGADDPVETLRGLVRGLVGFVGDEGLRQNHMLTLRVHAEGLDDPALAASYTAIHHDIVAQFLPMLQTMQRSGQLPADLDVEYLLWVLMTVYQGLRVHKMLDPTIDLDRFGRVLLQVVNAALHPAA